MVEKKGVTDRTVGLGDRDALIRTPKFATTEDTEITAETHSQGFSVALFLCDAKADF